MAWIETIPPSEATGELKRFYDEAVQRAGRVYHIVRTMSLSPPVLEASMELYKCSMYARDGLTRRQRELLAVVVSVVNHCHY
ncbi:MAG: carboxymuconolactone decarboxylase family protein [Planctomycetota bacterium]|nr:carboxymuconolactone decarboxylase family protein [Planctomycetota bacterium]